MRFPAPCRCAKPAFPINRRDTMRPATRTSRLADSNSAAGDWACFSTRAAGVSVQRNSRGYGSCPRAWICSSFFWRCSNWSRGSNCKGRILSDAVAGEYSGPHRPRARNQAASKVREGVDFCNTCLQFVGLRKKTGATDEAPGRYEENCAIVKSCLLYSCFCSPGELSCETAAVSLPTEEPTSKRIGVPGSRNKKK